MLSFIPEPQPGFWHTVGARVGLLSEIKGGERERERRQGRKEEREEGNWEREERRWRTGTLGRDAVDMHAAGAVYLHKEYEFVRWQRWTLGPLLLITHTPVVSGSGDPAEAAEGPTQPQPPWPSRPGRHTHLKVVGCDHRSFPWTPDVLLHLPHGLKTLPAAAPVLIQLLQQHPFSPQEAQLPVIVRTGQQAKPK